MTAVVTPPTVCPPWCTRVHDEEPGYAVVHEDDWTSVDAVPEPCDPTTPVVKVAATRVDDDPAYICVCTGSDLLTADNAERLALALMDRVVALRAAQAREAVAS